MKKILFALLVMLALVVPVKGQELIVEDVPMPVERVLPKDSLPDLWIVLFDMSGSMRRGKISKNLSNNKNNNNYVPKIVDSLVSEYGDKAKDVFVLLEFGADMDSLDRINKDNNHYSNNELVASVIHGRRTNGDNYSSIDKQIRTICSNAYLFKYGMSYTSVVRPLSMFVVAKKWKLDFLRFRNVYSLMITDNGDNASDQWSSDYKTTKYNWGKHFACFTSIFPTIASSEFDFTSIKSGKFVEVKTLDVPPFYFLTQYVTYQECNPERKLVADTLVMVSDFHNDRFTLQMKPCGDSVNFVYVDTCRVNGYAVPVNRYLYLDDTIVVQYDKSIAKTFQNEVTVKGKYQEVYNDRVLGLRYRKVVFGETHEKAKVSTTFVLEETKAVEQQCLRVVALLLLLFLIFIIVWRRTIVVLSIYVNGKKWCIKRIAMGKLKQGRFELVNVLYSEELTKKSIKNVFYYRGKGITVKRNKDKKKKITAGQPTIVIQANRKLRITPEPIEPSRHVYEYNYLPNEIHISFSERLKHDLIIASVRESWQEPHFETNPLQERSFQMLASYYESNAEKVTQAKNNVMVNLIRRESLGKEYSSDYAVLNIYDLNYGNSARKILLRYSLMCTVDLGQAATTSVTDKLLQVAHDVLKNEHLVKGTEEVKPYTEEVPFTSSIELEVSPMLSYLYISNGRSRKLLYSPFKDVRFDMAGYIDMKSKTVNLYRRDENLTMSNSPVLGGDSFGEVELTSYRRKSDTLSFLGDGDVYLLGEKGEYAYGRRLPNTIAEPYYVRKLNEIMVR